MMTMGAMIDVQDLPAYLHTHPADNEPALPLPLGDAGTLVAQERLLLMQALEKAGGNQSKAARFLRISRDALRYKLKKHNLDTPEQLRGSAAANDPRGL